MSRSKGMRGLNKMNGDFLLELKKPIRSEMGAEVRGRLHAHKASLAKQVNNLFNERNYQLNKIKRSQDSIYASMLKAHKMKKIRQREEYREMQEKLRAESERERASVSRLSLYEENEIAEEEELGAANSEPQKTHVEVTVTEEIESNLTPTVITRKLKTLEVSKSPEKPSVVERECSIVVTPPSNLQKFGKIEHAVGVKSVTVARSPTPSNLAVGVLPVKALSEPVPRRATRERTASQPEPVSQIQINQMKKLRREQRRKEILDNEPLTVFVRSQDGSVVPSILPFKKKEFQPSSLREAHFREKMLRAQREARFEQEEKIDQFFDKLDADGVERKRWEIRERELPVIEETKGTTKEEMPATLTDMMTAFKHRCRIPKHVDPKSYEALKYCKYLRPYSMRKSTRRRRRKTLRQTNEIAHSSQHHNHGH